MSEQSPQNGPAPGPPAPSATRSAGFAPQVMARAPAPAFIPPAVGGGTSQIAPSPFAQPPSAPAPQPAVVTQPPGLARIPPPDTAPMFEEGRGTLPAPEPTGAAALPFVAPPPLLAPPAPPPPAYAVPPAPPPVHVAAAPSEVTPPPAAVGSALPFAQAPAASPPGLAFAAPPPPTSEAGLAFAAPPAAPQAAPAAAEEEDLMASRWAQPARIAPVELPSNFAPVAAPVAPSTGKAAPPPKVSDGHGRTLVIVLSVLAVAVIIALGVVYKMTTREGSNDPISIGVLLGSTPDEPAPTATASASAAPKPVYQPAPKKKKDNEDFYDELEKK